MGGGALIPLADWPALKALALGLNLPEVTVAHPWGHECLKAHGKMWCWWSPFVDAAAFRAGREEQEMPLQADTPQASQPTPTTGAMTSSWSAAGRWNGSRLQGPR